MVNGDANIILRWLNTLCIARTEPHIWFLRQEGDEISAPVVRLTAVPGDGGSGGGDGGFAPSQYVASAIRKEREGKRGEGGKMAAEIKFLRSLEKMPSAAPTDPRSLAEVH